jgi:hypothetical protein
MRWRLLHDPANATVSGRGLGCPFVSLATTDSSPFGVRNRAETALVYLSAVEHLNMNRVNGNVNISVLNNGRG